MILVMWYMMAKGDRMVVVRSLVLVEEVEPEMMEPRVREQYNVNTRLMMVVDELEMMVKKIVSRVIMETIQLDMDVCHPEEVVQTRLDKFLSKFQNLSGNNILVGRDFKVNDQTVGVVNSGQKRKRKAGVSDGQTTKCLKHTTKP